MIMYLGDKLSIGKTIMLRDINGETDFTIDSAKYRITTEAGIIIESGDCLINNKTIHFNYQAETIGSYRVLYKVFINGGEIQKTLTDNITIREA